LHTTLTITGLQTYGYHGMFDAERELGQKFIFDVSATLTPAQTHLPDKLDASVRYDEVVQEIIRISDASTFRTLEALAETIARRLLERYAVMQRITVSVAKASPPIQHMLEQIRIEVALDGEEARRHLMPKLLATCSI
jgi:dihydroneopterin aldolase